MKKPISVLIIVIMLVFIGCKDDKQPPQLSGELTFSFEFSSSDYFVGQAICLDITASNGTSQEMALKDFPAKKLELFDSSGKPVKRFQRTEYPRPPKMFLRPGEESKSMVDLSGTFENFGPGMLAPGEYKLRATMSYYSGEDIKFRQRLLKFSGETRFTVSEPSGNAKKSFVRYVSIMGGEESLGKLVGVADIELDSTQQAKLNELAETSSETPIGERVLINHLAIWYNKAPLEHYSLFFEDSKTDCPCCLYHHVIDRMIKRYIITAEREQILDIVEEALKQFPKDSEIGQYLRKVFGFRIEEGVLIR